MSNEARYLGAHRCTIYMLAAVVVKLEIAQLAIFKHFDCCSRW